MMNNNKITITVSMVVVYHKGLSQLVSPLLLRFSVVFNVDPMDPVHGVQASQVGHPLAFKCLESGKVTCLVQERYPNS